MIEALIAAKGTLRSRAPFRPQREAEMMRRLAARHAGALPLATVEHLWREIITTFTFMQAPFRIVVDYGREPMAIHDLARFAFGFSVEIVSADGPADVVARIAASGANLGPIPRKGALGDSAWWSGLSAERGPRVMALLPFIAAGGRVAGAPAFVLSPTLAEPSPPDLRVVAGSASAAAASAFAAATDIAVLEEAQAGGRSNLLLAVAAGIDDARLARVGLQDTRTVGGIARGLAEGEAGGLLRAPLSSGRAG